jgi:hypothetical protein
VRERLFGNELKIKKVIFLLGDKGYLSARFKEDLNNDRGLKLAPRSP